ncbi:MAG: HD-GYP domain-containing protein [Candidatus Izemoplasmataceae bacterium]
MFQGKYKSALRVAFVYFLFSSIWIFSSDTFLTMVIEDIEDFRNFSSIKGIFFVLISSTIVYYLIKHEINLSDKAKKDIDILANYDSLTKLYTRKKYEIKLNDLQKEKKQCGVILTDINGLRVYNEAFSYKAGDDIITLYSDILKEIFPEEFIARLGGDEFVILFEDVEVDILYTNMDELQLRVEQFSYQGLPIEVSVGFAYITDVNEDINELTSLAEARMNKNKLLQAHSSSNSLITSLQTTLFERSDETEQHAQRMQDMCERMGNKLGFSSAQTNDLKLLALLHDIGKIGIDDAILKKPDKLTSSEMEEMKQHPMIGFRIASTIPQLEAISYDILTHHEWVNGEGYPKKLKGGDIPLNARILSIVDAFDAMTNDRIYRKKISKDEAIEELFRFKDIQFDADLVDAFIDEFSKN